MSDYSIRSIGKKDYYAIEWLAKRAFWNLNMPGCDEHYLVHKLWKDTAYVPEVSLAAESGGEIVGAILYAKCRIETERGNQEVLTFGPLCVEPKLQKSGIGAALLSHSMNRARECGYKAILICGVPAYYPRFDFKTADTWGITMPDGSNFDAFMGMELVEGGLAGMRGKFYEADVYLGNIHDKSYMDRVDAFDKGFPYMEKKVLPHQWR